MILLCLKGIKIVARYIDVLESLAKTPDGKVVTLDLSGTATDFSNWVEDTLFRGLLQMNARYNEAYMRHHQRKEPGVVRHFIIDPLRISSRMIDNLKFTLEEHLELGLNAGIIFSGSKIPNEVFADIGNLADKVVVDFGHFAALDPGDPDPTEIFVSPEAAFSELASKDRRLFSQIIERVAWTMDRRNIDALVTRPEEVTEVVQELERRLRDPEPEEK